MPRFKRWARLLWVTGLFHTSGEMEEEGGMVSIDADEFIWGERAQKTAC